MTNSSTRTIVTDNDVPTSYLREKVSRAVLAVRDLDNMLALGVPRGDAVTTLDQLRGYAEAIQGECLKLSRDLPD